MKESVEYKKLMQWVETELRLAADLKTDNRRKSIPLQKWIGFVTRKFLERAILCQSIVDGRMWD